MKQPKVVVPNAPLQGAANWLDPRTTALLVSVDGFMAIVLTVLPVNKQTRLHIVTKSYKQNYKQTQVTETIRRRQLRGEVKHSIKHKRDKVPRS